MQPDLLIFIHIPSHSYGFTVNSDFHMQYLLLRRVRIRQLRTCKIHAADFSYFCRNCFLGSAFSARERYSVSTLLEFGLSGRPYENSTVHPGNIRKIE